ncbi:MAG: hypothetical protein ACI4U5_02755 [Bacilli bacterium]
MNLLDYSLSLLNRVLDKEITFAQAMNKYANQLNVDNSDVTKIKDVLKSVINRYYFFKWELSELISSDFSSDEINILVISLAFARYARNVTINDVLLWLEESINDNSYKINLQKACSKISSIYEKPTPIDEYNKSIISKRLSLMYSYPEWLIKMWLKHYGPKNTIKTISFTRSQTPIALSINMMKGDFEALNNDNDFTKSKLTTSGYSYVGKGKLNENKFFLNHDIFVLDHSIQFVIDILDPYQGDKVLVCSDNKPTVALAIDLRMNDFGKVNFVCSNISSVNQARSMSSHYRINNLFAIESDLSLLITHYQHGEMDKVLCMPPCSDFGLIRKKPEIVLTFQKEDMDKLIKVQKEYIEEFSKYVKEEGTFVYSVPTLNDKESRKIVKEFLTNHQDFFLEEENIIFPYKYQTDGIYYAKMIKKSEEDL